MACRKTRGLGAGRKLKAHRKSQRWADKDYKKSHLGNQWKKPFQGASHAKGIVLEKMCVLLLSAHRVLLLFLLLCRGFLKHALKHPLSSMVP